MCVRLPELPTGNRQGAAQAQRGLQAGGRSGRLSEDPGAGGGKRRKTSLSDEEKAAAEAEYKDLVAKRTDAFNLKQTFDPAHEKDKIRETAKLIKDLDGQIKAFKKKEEQLAHDRKAAAANDAAFNRSIRSSPPR